MPHHIITSNKGLLAIVIKKYAVFDIDGTLIRWQLFHATADELARHGYMPKATFEKARIARLAWKKRTQDDSFSNYEYELVTAYNQAIVDLPVKEFKTAIDSVFNKYKDQVYIYTRDLIRQLKAKNYILFALSGSQDEIVKMFADYYGFDAAAGSTFEQFNDKFTGIRHILNYEQKTIILEELIQRFGVSRKDSIAIGDSEGDIEILRMAEHPVAFNPTRKLFDYAYQHGWEIIVERKNMIYKLSPKDGRYMLTPTAH